MQKKKQNKENGDKVVVAVETTALATSGAEEKNR